MESVKVVNQEGSKESRSYGDEDQGSEMEEHGESRPVEGGGPCRDVGLKRENGEGREGSAGRKSMILGVHGANGRILLRLCSVYAGPMGRCAETRHSPRSWPT